MAEFSQLLGFLVIFKDSFKLLYKNGKFMAPITLLSLLLPSLLLLLFIHIYQTLTNSILKTLDSNSSSYLPIITYSSLLFIFEIISIFIFVAVSHISGIATILVSATSLTDTNISPQHLYSRIRTATKRKLFTLGFRTSSNRSSSNGILVLATIVWMFLDFLAIFYRNPITISIAVVLGISVFASHLYFSVAKVLSHVVSIVEDKYEGSEALEKAEEIVQGQRHHGFMINLFFNLVFFVFLAGYWVLLNDGLGFVNVKEFLLVLVNCISLAKIYVCVAYTVLYFRCKKYHGEEIGVVGNFDYSKLPAASNLGGDIP